MKGSRFTLATASKIITSIDDLVLVHEICTTEARSLAESIGKKTKKILPVAFFRTPSPVSTLKSLDNHIAVGCDAGDVLLLRDSS
jgi:hypothetical protein